jgi:hypothetical protein
METRINQNGYVEGVDTAELEHRAIAESVLRRDLAPNEIVHHINGEKTDNRHENLCVMDVEKHEHFHAWLDWKKKKSGNYPPLDEQHRVLVAEYGGILLGDRENSQTGTIRSKAMEMRAYLLGLNEHGLLSKRTENFMLCGTTPEKANAELYMAARDFLEQCYSQEWAESLLADAWLLSTKIVAKESPEFRNTIAAAYRKGPKHGPRMEPYHG